MIPVRNWWYMLLYAWDMADFKDRFRAEIEHAPDDLRALLTTILVYLMKRQVRRGLRGNYVERSEELQGVRGRIDFSQTLRDLSMYRGRLHCEYEEFRLNVPRNQIIRSTLGDSLNKGFASVEKQSDKYPRLISDLEALIRMLYEIDRVRVTRRLIASELRMLGSNEREYKLMLKICEMLQDPSMPDTGEASDLDFIDWVEKQKRERIFEKFVANFYKLRLDAWNVSAQLTLRWNEPHSPSDDNVVRLPTMRPDIVLEHKECKKRIVIDTKWYSNVVTDRHDQQTVHSSNLYQMYAYLASQDHRGKPHSNATGILLYAQTNEGRVDFRTKIDEHPFQVYTLNLTQDWQDIEDDLKTLLKPR